MKRAMYLLILASLAAALLVGCGGEKSSSQPETTTDPANSQTGNVANSGIETQPGGEPAEVDEARLQEIYNILAPAAGLEGTREETKTDLNAGGGITVDNILALIGRSSIVNGDSGFVLVMQVAPGTADKMVKELEAYRAAFSDGPDYEEFAESQEAMGNARIEAHGDIVVYVATSVETNASYDDVDAALQQAFGG